MSTCTTASQALAEPLPGTAAPARTWLLLEQPGPWGVKALTSSQLAPRLGRALEAAAKDTGVRLALIRRPGRHADPDPGAPARADEAALPVRQVYAAHTLPGLSWLHDATVTDPEQLLDLDFEALGAGDPYTFDRALGGRPHTGDPLALVCTNGKRDRCCAVLGRPLATELAAAGVPGIWEVTHLGGHRFAPTVLVLPYGYAYGRATAPLVQEALRGVREGRIVLEGCRGGSAWERPGQAAELAVRAHTGVHAADALTVARTEGTAPHWEVTVAHADGRLWRVTVVRGASSPPRPESCGSVLGSPARMDVTAVRELHPTAAGTRRH
ncbi:MULTISPECIES: sucrase ferredoxin [unclassified Streptomyces]|uniref:sucrase ferredoxin n=1 Tax=unclassified Streptomyces TaxID=2593676 RepID=UPI0004C14D7A|nr:MULTISPECIES: sucrase ferredoxin [unclassified Streptomyces]